MVRIMSKENDWDHNEELDAVDWFSVVCKVVQTLHKVKTGRAAGPSDVSFELISRNSCDG